MKYSDMNLGKCPFCGESQNIMIEYNDQYRIVCGECGASCGWYVSDDEAIKTWNDVKRTSSKVRPKRGLIDCTSRIELRCGKCSVPIRLSDKFCWNCGTEIDL